MLIMAARLRDLPSDFGEQYLPYKPSLRQRIQGRKYANESYIASVKLFKGKDGEFDVKSAVFRSQRKSEKPHSVNMVIGSNCINDAHCSCKAGISGECSHVLAVVLKLTDWLTQGLLDIPSQPACTSQPQGWDRPRGVKICPEPVSTVVMSRSGISGRKRKPLVPTFTDNRKVQLLDRDIELLKSMKGTPLGYLACSPYGTSDTPQGPQFISSTLSHQLPLINPIDEPTGVSFPCPTDWEFPATPNVGNLDIVGDYRDHFDIVKVTKEEAVSIEQNTREQSGSSIWIIERKKRLTASNFGKIMNRKSAINQKCVDSIMSQKQFRSAPTDYGAAKESVASILYRKKTGNHVHDCGLMINPLFPCISATPDGKVCSEGESALLEIKCPFWCRDINLKDAMERAIDEKRDFHLQEINGSVSLKKGHNYWWQVQGQLLVSGARWCDFVTYTRCDLSIIRVHAHRDSMEAILSKMCSIYNKFVY